MSNQLSENEVFDLLMQDRKFEFGYSTSSKAEKEFQEHIIEHIHDIISLLRLPKISSLRQQYTIKSKYGSKSRIALDIVVFHEDKTTTVFEVKCFKNTKGVSEQVKSIGQLLLYDHIIKSNFGFSSRLFLIDWYITPEIWEICVKNELSISLLEFNKDRLFLAYGRYV